MLSRFFCWHPFKIIPFKSHGQFPHQSVPDPGDIPSGCPVVARTSEAPLSKYQWWRDLERHHRLLQGSCGPRGARDMEFLRIRGPHPSYSLCLRGKTMGFEVAPILRSSKPMCWDVRCDGIVMVTRSATSSDACARSVDVPGSSPLQAQSSDRSTLIFQETWNLMVIFHTSHLLKLWACLKMGLKSYPQL